MSKKRRCVRGKGKFSAFKALVKRGGSATRKYAAANYKSYLKKAGIGIASGAGTAAGSLIVNRILDGGRHKKKKKRKRKRMRGRGVGGYIAAGQAAYDLLAPETKYSRPSLSWKEEIRHLRNYSNKLDD